MTVGNVNGMAESLWLWSFLTCQPCLGLSTREFLASAVMVVPGRAPTGPPALQGGLTLCAHGWRCCVLSNCDLGNDSELLLNPISCCAFHFLCHLLYSPAHFEAATVLHVALAGPELRCHYSSGAHLEDDSSSGLEQSSPKHPQECQGSGGSCGSSRVSVLGQPHCDRDSDSGSTGDTHSLWHSVQPW